MRRLESSQHPVILSAVINVPKCIDMKTEREKGNTNRKGSYETDPENDHQSSEMQENTKDYVKERKRKRDGKKEMSLLFTLMLQCSSLRRGRTWGPYHPICCPCLCVSQLISWSPESFFNSPSSPSSPFPVPHFLYLCLSAHLPLIYQRTRYLSTLIDVWKGC